MAGDCWRMEPQTASHGFRGRILQGEDESDATPSKGTSAAPTNRRDAIPWPKTIDLTHKQPNRELQNQLSLANASLACLEGCEELLGVLGVRLHGLVAWGPACGADLVGILTHVLHRLHIVDTDQNTDSMIFGQCLSSRGLAPSTSLQPKRW